MGLPAFLALLCFAGAFLRTSGQARRPSVCTEKVDYILGNLTGWLTSGVKSVIIEEIIRCYSSEGECQDVDWAPCGVVKCDDLVSVRDFMLAIPNLRLSLEMAYAFSIGVFRGSFLASEVCPRSCGRCGGERLSGPRYEPCEAGWSYADGECFKYNYGGPGRRRSEMFVDWFEADSACQAESARLATVETKAHEHLVFQLVRQRPDEVSPSGMWAWVGKPSGRDGYAHYTNDIWKGETLTFSSVPDTSTRRAWVCSKPSQVRAIKEGLCQDFGFVPISDMAMCSEMSKALLGMDKTTIQRNEAPNPFGCFMPTRGRKLYLSVHPDSRSIRAGNLSKSQHLFCRRTNVTPTNASDPEPKPEFQADAWAPPQTMAVARSFGRTTLALVLALGIFPVLFLGVAALAVYTTPALRKIRSAGRWCAQYATRSDDCLGEAISMRFRELRCSIARGLAAVLVAFHLFELLRLSLVEDSVCSSGHVDRDAVFRSELAAVHLASLWVATAFLAACAAFQRQKQWRYRLRLPFVLAVVALEFLEVAFEGEQALLVESRFYRQLLWRLLLGSCVSLWIAIPTNAVSGAGVCVLYWKTIPDGQVFTVGSSRAGLLFELGCNQLWPADTATTLKDMVLASVRLIDASNLNGQGRETASSAAALFEELLKKRTAFLDFALAEAAMVAVATVCLALLGSLLHSLVSQSLCSQNTQAQLKAVESMLDNLCDATFNLNVDGSIGARALKLDVLLHTGPTPGNMQGSQFRSIIASAESRADFDGAIQKCVQDDPGAGSPIYIDLQAASASTVRVQLVCGQFTDVSGERHLICGANEVHRGNDEGAEGVAETPGPDSVGDLPPPRGGGQQSKIPPITAGRGTPGQSSLEDVSGIRSDSGSSGDESEASVGSGDADVRRLECDLKIFTESGKVEYVSKSFRKLFKAKAGPGDNLADLAKNPKAFLASVKQCMEAKETREMQAGMHFCGFPKAPPCTVTLVLRRVWEEPTALLRVSRVKRWRAIEARDIASMYVSGPPQIEISEVVADHAEWRSQFKTHGQLTSWLGQPGDLLRAFERAIKDQERNGGAPSSLGTFAFKAPGSGAPVAEFSAEVTLNGTGDSYLLSTYLLTLRRRQTHDCI